jgi:hypothetical protein
MGRGTTQFNANSSCHIWHYNAIFAVYTNLLERSCGRYNLVRPRKVREPLQRVRVLCATCAESVARLACPVDPDG